MTSSVSRNNSPKNRYLHGMLGKTTFNTLCLRLVKNGPEMKKGMLSILIISALVAGVCCFSSCQKAGNNPPTVELVTSTGYVSVDTTMYHGTPYTVWVYASKMGVGDLIESGSISRRINGGDDSVLQTMSFVKTYFSELYSYNVGDSGSVYTYTFSFANQNGKSNSVKLNITAK